MTIRITSAQRLILSDCVRFALVGWLLTDPVVGQAARRIEYKSTTIAGFQFSQFASLTQVEIGASYHGIDPTVVSPAAKSTTWSRGGTKLVIHYDHH